MRRRCSAGRQISFGSRIRSLLLPGMALVVFNGLVALGEDVSDTAKSNSGPPSAEGPASADKAQPNASTRSSDKLQPGSDRPEAEVKKPLAAGNPQAAGMVTLLRQEIANALRRRRVYEKYTRFRRYAAGTLKSTSGAHTGSELTGNCRLQWYSHLLSSPLSASGEAEQFTRQVHKAALDEQQALGQILAIAAEKLDLNKRQPPTFKAVESPDEALEVIKRALTGAQLAYCRALAPLSKSEIRKLADSLYPTLTSQNRVGHTVQSRGTGRYLCDLMEKLDRNALSEAAEALAPISDPRLLEQLRSIGEEDSANSAALAGVAGQVVRRIDTASGTIIVGGREKNTYRLDSMPRVNVVIDLGGDDIYYDGTASLRRPVMIVIDLDGNDAYESKKPGVQGSAMLGISMLLDAAGNDVYRARDLAQGSCLAGAGILIDYAGNDVYVGLRRVQGQAMCGVGILIDRNGNDRYHGALWTQGMGGPLGFGLLDDLDGKDHYYTGGLYLNSYLDDDNPTPGYEGWGQGMGGGLRAVANGGIGVILDGGGDDVYEYDYLSHGGGYWCGLGFARDFGGNDQRLGPTRKAYDGGNRTQRRFTRFSSGFGCHYALGFLFDDEGDDTYNTTIMGVGYSWDCSVGYLCDFGGNDRYSGNEGQGAQAGVGVLFDYDGQDVYLGSKQGRASSGISYHSLPGCGGNFSFVIDYGGTDKYGCRARNNSYIQRGSSGGFLIDRPKRENATKTADRPSTAKATGS